MLFAIVSSCAMGGDRLSFSYEGQHEGIEVLQDFYVKPPHGTSWLLFYVYYYEDRAGCELYDNRILTVEIDSSYKINTDSAYLQLQNGVKMPAKLLSVKEIDKKRVVRYYFPVTCNHLRNAKFVMSDISSDGIKLSPVVVKMEFKK